MSLEEDKELEQLLTLNEKIAFCEKRLSELRAELEATDAHVTEELKNIVASEVDRKAITPTINDAQAKRSERIAWWQKRLAELQSEQEKLLSGP